MKFNFLLLHNNSWSKTGLCNCRDNPFGVLVFEEVTHPFHEKKAQFLRVFKSYLFQLKLKRHSCAGNVSYICVRMLGIATLKIQKKKIPSKKCKLHFTGNVTTDKSFLGKSASIFLLP